MKSKLALISIALMLTITGAMACHYWCFGTGYTVPGTPDITAKVNQVLTFTGSDAAATYVWTFRDENGAILQGPTPGSSFAITIPAACPRYYTVEWTATVPHGNSLSCVTKGCIKIAVPCEQVTCPQFPDYCTGVTPVPYPVTVTAPTGYTLAWTIDGGDAGTGNAPTGWDTLAVGTHTIVMQLKLGSAVVQTCTDTVVVFSTPTGGYSWT